VVPSSCPENGDPDVTCGFPWSVKTNSRTYSVTPLQPNRNYMYHLL
jgi:hypothetical protein